MNLNEKKDFISFLIDSNILIFGEFTTKSGRNTPYFINTGNFKYGKQLNTLGKFYAKLIINSNVSYSAMFGPAYKGIPLVVNCCNHLYSEYNINKPFFFNRKEEKDHGEGGTFIGYIPKDNEKIIIIEDVLTAGTAIKEVLPKIKHKYKIICNNLFVLVDRCELAKEKNIKASVELEENYGIKVHSLINIKDIIEYIKNNEKYAKYIDKILKYTESYCIL